MIVDENLEKKCSNGQTSFFITKLKNELFRKTDASILTQKSPSPIICKTPSQLTFSETEYHKNEITTLYEKLREINREMRAMKSFVGEQILLFKNSDKLSNNAQLQEKSNEKYLTKEIFHLREEKKTKNCIIQMLMENQNNLLNHIKPTDENHSKMFSMQHAQSKNFIASRLYSKNCDASKSFTIETRNQFQPLENVIEEHLTMN